MSSLLFRTSFFDWFFWFWCFFSVFWFLLGNRSNFFFFFIWNSWISNNNVIRNWDFATESAWGIIWQHNLDFNSHNTLFKEYVSNSLVDIIFHGFTSTNHISLFKFHCFSSLLFQFSGNNDFASFSTIKHNRFNNRVGSKSYWDIV